MQYPDILICLYQWSWWYRLVEVQLFIFHSRSGYDPPCHDLHKKECQVFPSLPYYSKLCIVFLYILSFLLSPVVKVPLNHMDWCGKILLTLDIEHSLMGGLETTNSIKFICCKREHTDAFGGGVKFITNLSPDDGVHLLQIILYLPVVLYVHLNTFFSNLSFPFGECYLCSLFISMGHWRVRHVKHWCFNFLIDFLTFELKFVPAYLKTSLSVFQYWVAC